MNIELLFHTVKKLMKTTYHANIYPDIHNKHTHIHLKHIYRGELY